MMLYLSREPSSFPKCVLDLVYRKPSQLAYLAFRVSVFASGGDQGCVCVHVMFIKLTLFSLLRWC
jgi:hypothetical protein